MCDGTNTPTSTADGDDESAAPEAQQQEPMSFGEMMDVPHIQR